MNASHLPVLDLHPRHGIHAPTVATPTRWCADNVQVKGRANVVAKSLPASDWQI